MSTKKTALTAAAALAVLACAPPVDEVPVAGDAEAAAVDSQLAARDTVDPSTYRWDHPSNLLANASFEEGREPWYNKAVEMGSPFWVDFRVSDLRAHSGSHSAVVQLRSEGFRPHTCVNGVIQSFSGIEIPRHIGGRYRIEEWQRGCKFQFLQVVISVIGAKGFNSKDAPTQLAFLLDGTTRAPYPMGNRKFVAGAGSEVPIQDRWVRFDIDLAATFEREWKRLPAPDEYEKFEIFFEARFDKRDDYDPYKRRSEVRANVYFDDLYLGNGAER